MQTLVVAISHIKRGETSKGMRVSRNDFLRPRNHAEYARIFWKLHFRSLCFAGWWFWCVPQSEQHEFTLPTPIIHRHHHQQQQ